MKALIISNPRYSVRAQHPHLKVREVGTHPGEHTENVTTLPAPDFICPYLKVTADKCLKASAIFPHAYICPLDPSWGDNARGGDTCGHALTEGGRNVSGERHSQSRPPLTTPFLLHDFMEEAFPASVFSPGQVLLFLVLQNLITIGLRGCVCKLRLFRHNSSGIWKSKLFAPEISDY